MLRRPSTVIPVSKLTAVLAVSLVLALLAAACGADSTPASNGEPDEVSDSVSDMASEAVVEVAPAGPGLFELGSEMAVDAFPWPVWSSATGGYWCLEEGARAWVGTPPSTTTPRSTIPRQASGPLPAT